MISGSAIAASYFRTELLLKLALSFWAPAKLYRWKYDADYPLDRTAKILHWLIVIVCFSFALLAQPFLATAALAAAVAGSIFLAWPNLSYHLANQFRPEPPAS